ncbi:hypothetical protein [Capillimicrobium parvum]|uniref:hypothetical protein n=1 Tax=Capillimicrobium parvum TaxID=2884022 RepID=UPI00216B3293|nr:hypothetical protein [Capillimicrobium parvum]
MGVAVYGTGRAGTEIVRACGLRPDVRVVAGIAATKAKEGADLGAVTVGAPLGVEVTCDLEGVLARPDVDVVLHAGIGTPPEVASLLGRCADAGKDAITVAGLVHPPTALGAEGAAALHGRARDGGARVVGTGVNPGFLLDALPAVWGSMVGRVDRLHARRVGDIRHWGAGALDGEVGLGRPPEEVRGNRALSLDESLALVAEALDLRFDRTEDLHEALPAPNVREHGGRRVAPGRTMGFRRRSIGRRGGDVLAEIEWIAIFCLDPARDGVEEAATLRIEGDSNVEASASGTFFGDPYPSTAARAVNAIGPLRSLPPGLYRPDELPSSSRPR